MTPEAILKKHWGYDSFRPLQLDIINSVMAGKDTLGLLPTGGGKSLTFQVPALLLPGVTIVVTPLISLMKDQVDNLKAINIRAAALYTGMSRRECNNACDKARLGKIKLLYVSPERLRSETFRDEMRSWQVSLIVVDEAHCISQWGYDFRPSYLRISSLREIFPNAPILALTASATPKVREDIIENLHFKPDHATFALSFHRTNLSYVVRQDRDKESKLVEALSSVRGSAIVYVRSRRATAQYAAALVNAGIPATFYHAGLDPAVKEERQQMWKDGRIRVIVATNAFGMGIDKPDVRVVVHMDIPPSLEEYYQEAGRAGRDGRHAYALTIAAPHDKAILSRRLSTAFPPKEFILHVYEKACVFMQIAVGEGYGHVYEFDLKKFCTVFKLQPETVRGALAILTNAGYLDYSDDPTTHARVTILIRRDEFYHIGLEATETAVVNSLLRLYPGLFADYVNIDEGAMATMLRITRENVYQALLSLSRKKIIDYVPKRELPYIYMPTSRELTKHVVINRSVYEDRRQLMEARIDAIRNFVYSSEKCRDKILLEYFGETDSENCGMCDVCKEKLHPATLKPEELETQIADFIEKNPGIGLETVTRKFAKYGADADTALRKLINTGRVERQALKLFRVKS